MDEKPNMVNDLGDEFIRYVEKYQKNTNDIAIRCKNLINWNREKWDIKNIRGAIIGSTIGTYHYSTKGFLIGYHMGNEMNVPIPKQ